MDELKTPKDTSTVTRYKLIYTGKGSKSHLSGHLFIEISHRVDSIDEKFYLIHEGMQIATSDTARLLLMTRFWWTRTLKKSY